MNKDLKKLLVVIYIVARYPLGNYRERKRRKQILSTMNTVQENYQKSKKNRFEHFERVYDVSLYILTFEYDILFLKQSILFCVNDWKKKLYARLLAIQLYEASMDFPKILGRDFRKSLSCIGILDDEMEKLNLIMKKINRFKIKNKDILSDIRNYVGAHRDNRGIKQLEIIEEIDPLEIMKVTAELYQFIKPLISFIIYVTKKMGSFEVILRNMKKSEKGFI